MKHLLIKELNNTSFCILSRPCILTWRRKDRYTVYTQKKLFEKKIKCALHSSNFSKNKILNILVHVHTCMIGRLMRKWSSINFLIESLLILKIWKHRFYQLKICNKMLLFSEFHKFELCKENDIFWHRHFCRMSWAKFKTLSNCRWKKLSRHFRQRQCRH